jgi:hypothetical protein
MARTCFFGLFFDCVGSFHFDDGVCQNIDIGLTNWQVSIS